MSTNGNIYIGSKCGTLEIYNKEELICLYSKKISKEYLSCITMTEDKKYLGVGGGDNYIYIFNVFESEELLSLYHVFKGHSSFVKHIDFTRNGNFMRSNSASNDLLFWNIKTKQQEVNRSQYSNEKWATKYCTIEFNVSGIWKEGIDGSDINTCDVIKCQESNESLLATGDDFGNVILYKYPYIRKNNYTTLASCQCNYLFVGPICQQEIICNHTRIGDFIDLPIGRINDTHTYNCEIGYVYSKKFNKINFKCIPIKGKNALWFDVTRYLHFTKSNLNEFSCKPIKCSVMPHWYKTIKYNSTNNTSTSVISYYCVQKYKFETIRNILPQPINEFIRTSTCTLTGD
ncbi:hypothetical protein A3Q56_03624 [Intoshia linei]|uniref:EML-like second beta-propeller domain-containing protein n=1 Tax=Intoshia linei TaxID=1819745 RepID=A0A177B2X8_9BILA|nr:hypothetical protein A3Q56_03624 [Intoshia linei]